MPLGDMITDAINYLFLNNYGYYAEFDFSGISALTQPIAEKATAVTQFWNVGVPFMEINERLKLGFREFDGWDKPYGGRSQFATTPTEPVKTAKAADPLKPGNVPMKIQIEGMRKAAWIKLNDKVNPQIGKTAKSLRGYFRGINQKLMKSLSKEKAVKALSTDDIDAMIEGLTDDEKLKSIMRDDTYAAIKIGADTVQGLSDFQVKTMLAKRLDDLTEINETTKQLLKDGLHDALDEAVKAGMTDGQIAQVLIQKADELGEHNLKRARTIARTETHSAFSMGRHESVKETEPKYKRWISDIYSGKTRDTHAALHGQRVKFDEEFTTFNGDKIDYPLAPGTPAAESINCRCVITYEYGEDGE